MATVTLDAYASHTLVELANRIDPTGKLGDIANVLSEVNELMPDVYWQEGNDKTSHVSFKQSSEPDPTLRRIGLGVAASKGNIQPIRDTIMMTEGWSEVDERMAGLTGNVDGYRYQEDMAFLSGFTQSLTGYMVYGTNADEQMNGMATRRASIGSYCVTGGGTGSDLTSMFIAAWGPDLFGLYPAGSKIGFDWINKGLETDKDSSSRLMGVYRTQYKWDAGLGMRDDRALYRIPNVDTSSIATLAESSLPDVDDLLLYCMRKAKSRTGPGRVVIYGNSDALIILDRLAKDKTNVNYNPGQPFGGEENVMRYRGVPVHQTDQILSTETAIS